MKSPPYGRELKTRLSQPHTWPQMIGTSANGKVPQVWIAFGSESWDWAKPRLKNYLLMILPPDDEPETYNWQLTAKHFVLAANTGAPYEITKRLAVAVISSGAEKIMVLPEGQIFCREVDK